jgi:hypothetical protein
VFEIVRFHIGVALWNGERLDIVAELFPYFVLFNLLEFEYNVIY